MKIPPHANRHRDHPVAVQREIKPSPHWARLTCVTCGVWLKWLSQTEAQAIEQELDHGLRT